MVRPGGEFGASMEQATLTGSTALLTGPIQNLGSLASPPKAKDSDQPVYIAFDVNAAVGASFTCFCESGVPDYWIVTVRPVVGAKVSLFLNANNSGVPIRLSGGGNARLPGMSEYLTVLMETGSSLAPVTVVAVRGYKSVELNGGNLA